MPSKENSVFGSSVWNRHKIVLTQDFENTTKKMMKMMLMTAIAVVGLFGTVNSFRDDDDHPDRISSLPGWDRPLPSNWYSGYLDYEFEGRQVHTHYTFVEAENVGQENYDDLPVIYWSNGGPGASSMYGLLTELGPLWLSDWSLETEEYRQTGIPSLTYNANAWTRLGHILTIDQPAPVGFSYCGNDTETHSCGGIAWTDELATENAYLALQTFYKMKFPSLTSKSLYLTGESYAGIYIPSLARRILQGKENPDDDDDENPLNDVPFKGFAVGDGCLGTNTNICGELNDDDVGFHDYWHVLFMFGHHQIPYHDFRLILKACSHLHHDDDENDNNTNDIGPLFSNKNGGDHHPQNEICKAALNHLKEQLGGFFEYGLYDECTYRNGLLKQKLAANKADATDIATPTTSAVTSSDYTMMDIDGRRFHGGLNDYPCGGGPVMEEYLKLPQVKEALHVISDFFEVDNAGGDFDYTPTEPDLSGFYQQVHHNEKDFKVLIYNGDTDPAITSFGAQNWTSKLGFAEVQHWRPWTVDSCQRTGGYVTRYYDGVGYFDFLTIRGAGHMVPTNKPEAAYTFLKSWLSDDDDFDYPTYDANCTVPPEMKKEAVTGATTTTPPSSSSSESEYKRNNNNKKKQVDENDVIDNNAMSKTIMTMLRG